MTTDHETPDKPPTAKLGDLSVPLVQPSSLASRYDVLAAAATNLPRAACAALALAWKGPNRPKARKSHDVLDYGGRVMDELGERGYHPLQIMGAALAAYHVTTDGLITAAEVDEAEGNSEAPGDSTS
jgi:hypothetical protein